LSILFSVITITRNNLDGLRRTHESIAAQSYTNYEWIVIDGASHDGTEAYLKTTNDLSVSEPDHGIYDAMNKGIDRAQGEYLIFMNAGDVFAEPNTLEQLSQNIDADFIYGDAREDASYKTARPHKKITYGMFTHHQSMIYKRATIGTLRYDINYKIAADYKFTLEFLQRAQKISYRPLPICIFEQGGLSQKQVRLGRIEQFSIRRAAGFSMIQSAIIYAKQSITMLLRRLFPALYWGLRKQPK